MNPLLGKLTNLLGDEYKKLTGVKKQAEFLRDELSAMKALLDKMELMDKLDPSAKNWRDHVREMSYDMENCIDEFMHDFESADAKAGFVKKMAKRLRRLGKRHQIANHIKELKVLAVEANARRERYKIDDCVHSSLDVVAIDPRMSAIYKEVAGLVGIDGPREELVGLLMNSEKKLKVVSIVGFGGLGKTTLAKQVYDQVEEQFDCKAFVSVSQRPDLKSLLIGLQRKLGMGESSHSHELQDIIDRLRGYLKHKSGIVLPKGIENMEAIRTLRCSGISQSSVDDIKGLSELTNLKKLVLPGPLSQPLTVERVDALLFSVRMLRDHLEELNLVGCTFNRVPKWIGELRCLRILCLSVLHLSSDEVRVLGELTSLIYARLHVSEISQDKVVVGTGLFPVLEYVLFFSGEDITAYLSFEAGAMPKLQRLNLGFGWNEWGGATPVGMECLSCLRDIKVWLRHACAESSKELQDVRADVESAFKRAVRLHPEHPSVTLDFDQLT